MKKRLRGHHTIRSRYLLDQSTQQQQCKGYCTLAKCCNAQTIGDPGMAGLVLSPFGVYTDASSGEYVMTNCQVSNYKNVQLCERYKQLCATDITPTATPIPGESTITTATGNAANGSNGFELTGQKLVGADGSNSASLSGESSIKAPTSQLPSASPSSESSVMDWFNQTMAAADNSTLIAVEEDLNSTEYHSFTPIASPWSSSTTQLPTSTPNTLAFQSSNGLAPLVPSANTQNIQDSCSSEKAKFLIRTGDASARAECISSCLDGLCCFTNELGYSLVDSCYEGNEHRCSQYVECLILKVDSQQNEEDMISTAPASDNSEHVNFTSAHDNATFSGNNGSGINGSGVSSAAAFNNTTLGGSNGE